MRKIYMVYYKRDNKLIEYVPSVTRDGARVVLEDARREDPDTKYTMKAKVVTDAEYENYVDNFMMDI